MESFPWLRELAVESVEWKRWRWLEHAERANRRIGRHVVRLSPYALAVLRVRDVRKIAR